MTAPVTFLENRGIYGRVEMKGYKTHTNSPFVVFRNGYGKWVIAQERSGLAVMAMIPVHVQRSKRNLLDLVERMERELPEACAMIGLLDSNDWPEEIRPYGRQIIEWCAKL